MGEHRERNDDVRHMRAVPLDEADERFGVRSLFHLGANADAEVVVFSGDAALEQLPLDFSHLDSWTGLAKASPDMFLGVVVDGGLTVTDWITNWEWDFGPFLLVRGDVRAKNLATAGSEVLVEGDLDVTQTLAGIYNHGHTVIKGDTRAEVVLTDQHLTEFHGGLRAELGVAGNFLRVADPATVQVNGWAGYVCDLRGQILPGLGTRSTRALRALDPDFRELDSRSILKAVEAGRSLLHTPDPLGVRTPADEIRDALRLAGLREHDRWDDGFVVGAGQDGESYEVYFCEADEPEEPGVQEALNSAVEMVRYAEALTAAGYEVTVDLHEEDVLLVRR
ncbi:hypothetical protein [Streptomyces xylophagus]|uniref:hypothetical protein n=1 Tax=Streptomyces xylophagus TaxID=285514 RepID=UPI00131C5ED8|nr:hypothetical protein [Streptomyces xylophagus]